MDHSISQLMQMQRALLGRNFAEEYKEKYHVEG